MKPNESWIKLLAFKQLDPELFIREYSDLFQVLPRRNRKRMGSPVWKNLLCVFFISLARAWAWSLGSSLICLTGRDTLLTGWDPWDFRTSTKKYTEVWGTLNPFGFKLHLSSYSSFT